MRASPASRRLRAMAARSALPLPPGRAAPCPQAQPIPRVWLSGMPPVCKPSPCSRRARFSTSELPQDGSPYPRPPAPTPARRPAPPQGQTPSARCAPRCRGWGAIGAERGRFSVLAPPSDLWLPACRPASHPSQGLPWEPVPAWMPSCWCGRLIEPVRTGAMIPSVSGAASIWEMSRTCPTGREGRWPDVVLPVGE